MNPFDDALAIDTPENVYFNYKVAGIGSRFLAALVDTLLIALVEIAIGVLLFLPISNLLDDPTRQLSGWILAIFGLVTFAIFWTYYIFFETIWNGQTPGKRRVGLRVIRTDGMPITFTESAIRNLVRIIDFLPVNYALGVITMFVSDQSRRLGDLAAGTLVVYDHHHEVLPQLGQIHSQEHDPVLGEQANRWPTDSLTQTDLQMIEDYFQRRNQLSNRDELAKHILRALLMKMKKPEHLVEQGSAEDQLREIARAAQVKHR